MACASMAAGAGISISTFSGAALSRADRCIVSAPSRIAHKAFVQGPRCEAAHESSSPVLGRREALITFTAATTAVSGFGTYLAQPASAADLNQRRQRGEFLSKAKGILKDGLKENPAMGPLLLRLALNDIASYDKATKTGGPNGSIRFSEELSKPVNKGLDKAVAFLGDLKKKIDDGEKGGPISWADLIQLGAQSAAKLQFLNHAILFAGGDAEKGQTIYQAFGSAGQWGFFDKQLGRADASSADASSGFDWNTASAVEVKEKFASLGVKPRYLVTLTSFMSEDQQGIEKKLSEDPELAEYVKKYQRSRREISETEYEVDLITTFTKLSTLGQKINYEAYSYALPRPVFRF